MEYNKKDFFIIFDTNTLFHSYDKRGDFTSFYFNKTFDNIVEMVAKLDIYSYVTLVVPTTVWNEMTEHIIEAHSEKLKNFENSFAKHIFPDFDVVKKDIGDYSLYISPIIDKYRKNLASDITKVIEMPIAGPHRYDSIVQRAFQKLPPFGGKEKKSDKGFKDALLWESILDFTTQHINSEIIFYSKDNIFGDFLLEEFKQIFPDTGFCLCKNEDEIKQKLENWAKGIDIYSYQPLDNYIEEKPLIDWINSKDFLDQLTEQCTELTIKNRLMKNSTISLSNYSNIQHYASDQFGTQYTLDATLQIVYTLNGGAFVSENIAVQITIQNLLEETFVIEDVSMQDEY